MNQGLVVVLLALVAGSCGKSSGGHGRLEPPVRPISFLQQLHCIKVTSLTAAEFALLLKVTTKCIAAVPGLATVFAGLDPHSGHGGDRSRDAASVLEANGFLANATALRECIAEGMGMVNSNGIYDMDALKANILNKVGTLSIRNNIQLGLDNCPSVVEFDVVEYLHCVTTYCRTGAAP